MLENHEKKEYHEPTMRVHQVCLQAKLLEVSPDFPPFFDVCVKGSCSE